MFFLKFRMILIIVCRLWSLEGKGKNINHIMKKIQVAVNVVAGKSDKVAIYETLYRFKNVNFKRMYTCECLCGYQLTEG